MNIAEFIDLVQAGDGLKAKVKGRIYKTVLHGFMVVNDAICKHEEELNKLKAEFNTTKSDFANAKHVIASLDSELTNTKHVIASLDSELTNTKTVLHLTKQDLTTAQADLQTTKQELQDRERELAATNRELNETKQTLRKINNDIRYLKEQNLLLHGRGESHDKPADATTADATSGNIYGDMDYLDFENHFRGAEEAIKERQSIYLPFFQNQANVLDIGCGRGEMLSLLKDNDIRAKGIDIFPEYATLCKSYGLDVVAGDGISYLEQSKEEFGGIFVGQVVEHITIDQIVRLCNAAYDKLKNGASIIIETPNPLTLSTYTNAFYVDPSHQKPVHPLTIMYLLEKAGFEKRQIRMVQPKCSSSDRSLKALELDGVDGNLAEFNQSLQELSNHLYGPQDYAIIATKIHEQDDYKGINLLPYMAATGVAKANEFILQVEGKGVIFGPYIDIRQGSYLLKIKTTGEGACTLRITADKGKACYLEEKLPIGEVELPFTLADDAAKVEFVLDGEGSYQLENICYSENS